MFYQKIKEFLAKTLVFFFNSKVFFEGCYSAEFLGYNPFTASIEIKLNAAYANSDSLSWIQEKLLDKIERIEKPTEDNTDIRIVLEPNVVSGNIW